jgi:hypothetical protein
VPGLGVVADCRAFLAALDARARATGWYATRRAMPVMSRGPPRGRWRRATATSGRRS